MRSLDVARETTEKYHPGLGKAIAEVPFTEREQPGSPLLELFRTHGGPALLVPAAYGGQGAGPLDAVRVMRAIASWSPSLGAAVTMHHFTAATLFALAETADRLTPAQLDLLGRIAPEGLLAASGWAEGRTNQNILTPSVTAKPTEGGYLINGGKKPCSLAHSMDVLTASVSLPVDGEPTLAMLLMPAKQPGITVHPFWSTPVLAGAESDEVRLTDVFVPEELVVRTTPDDPHRLDDLQIAGFVWFEMLISSVYLGAASALVERVLAAGRGSITDRAALGVDVESAVGLIEGVARALEAGDAGEDTVAAVLVARFAVQDIITRVAASAQELLGGMAFISAPEVAYLASAVRPLAFHPPSRSSTAESLVEYFAGGPLQLS
ncbi:acyl-CoA dehydrogenase family protein [Micromonospora siamensis]|uniref:Acyl-CoA dehydrogenase n=1 Tax=Micromonospora siamensis TaxID=299152 RepID=A0A1C5HV85_9ACTN|nr:acyl-CoA dehydrogenase family protein [Micromonospora siamensis]SCG49828.1 Acyl-CoA dehydrogenase [Micromonospora siamensis]